MTKKPTVTTLASGFNSTETLNANFEALRDGFDNTLSLDGSTPNAMEADLDLNGNNIIGAAGLLINGTDYLSDVEAAKAAALAAQVGAETAETNAETAETNAESSETAAASSATAASTSATASAASAVDATNNGAAQVALATTAKTAAELAETNAETAESNAATSATSAATSATTASTGASTATTKASEAATSATNSATSATESETAKTAAEAAKDAALAALDSFDDRYLGSKASDPTLDNDGNALVAGALYYNTTDDVMKVYTGSVWVAAYASLSGALLTTNNLSDVVNVSSSRTNLGLGTAATTASTDYAASAKGVPVGGTTGQLLAKVDATDNNVEWVDAGGAATNNQSHRGWRLRRLTSVNGNYVGIGALEFNDVSGATTGGTPVYSTQYATSGDYSASAAFDGSDNTTWFTTEFSVANAYIGFWFDTTKELTSITVKGETQVAYTPTSFVIEYSDDNISWVEVQSYTYTFATNERKSFTLPTIGASIPLPSTYGTSGQVLAVNATLDGVEWVGALMDSEVDADIKTLVLPASTTISTFGASLVDDAAASNARTTLGLGTAATTASTAYATAAQGTLADSALQPTGDGSGLTNLTSGNLTGALPAIDGSALTGLALQNTYESSQQTVTSGLRLTLAHSLGASPSLIQFFLQCTTADGGFAVGDEIIVNPKPHSGTSNFTFGYWVDDTVDINIEFGTETNIFKVIDKAGVRQNIVNTSWRMVVRAWA